MLYDARTTTKQLDIAFMGRGTMKVLIACLELVEHVLTYGGTQFHVLDAPTEELKQFLTANPPHTAGHHGLNGSLRRLARQDARIVGYELAFEREPSEVVAPVAEASCYEFEATALHEAKPTCRIALALQLFTLAVFHHLALFLAEVK